MSLPAYKALLAISALSCWQNAGFPSFGTVTPTALSSYFTGIAYSGFLFLQSTKAVAAMWPHAYTPRDESFHYNPSLCIASVSS